MVTSTRPTPEEALSALWERLGRGGKINVARKLGLTQSTTTQWKKVPAEHVAAIEREFGVSRHELRPDLYEPPADAA